MPPTGPRPPPSELLQWLVALGPFLAAALPNIGAVPIFDGAQYAECTVAVAGQGIHPWAANCFGHPGIAWILPLSLVLKVLGFHAWVANLVAITWGVGALVAMRRILDALWPEASGWERALAVSAIGTLPVFLGSALNPGLDFGLAVFSMYMLDALVRRRMRVAAAWGLAMTFTKEPGLPIFLIAVASWLLAFVVRQPMGAVERRTQVKSVLPAVVPPLAFAAYLAARHVLGEELTWSDGSTASPLDELTRFRLYDRTFLSFCSMLFVVHFSWLASGVALAGAVRGLAGLAVAESGAVRVSGPVPGRGAFVALVLLGWAWLLTRHPTFVNARYLLPAMPLLVVGAGTALLGLVPRAGARQAFLAILALLFAVESQRLVDPISRAVYGTFDAGGRAELDATSLTGECCGHGRDQLVHSLEYLAIGRLVDDALAGIELGPDDAVGGALRADWFLVHDVVVGPGGAIQRAYPSPTTARIELFTVRRIGVAPLPARVYWLELPFVDGTAELTSLAPQYVLAARTHVERGGVGLDVFELHRR